MRAFTKDYHIKDLNVVALGVHMSEEELEVLITLDDPGEEDLEEDTFHDHKAEVVVDKDRSKLAG